MPTSYLIWQLTAATTTIVSEKEVFVVVHKRASIVLEKITSADVSHMKTYIIFPFFISIPKVTQFGYGSYYKKSSNYSKPNS